MATLTGSIEADVPLSYADREWRDFIGRSVYRRFSKEDADVASSITDIDANSGTVKFEQKDKKLVKVSVELDYQPHGADEPDVPHAQQWLTNDLGKYRTFLLRHCELEHCRAA
jgi:hypothetical protein